MATPVDYIWKSPGVPSLTQNYAKTDFYYFSPEVGLGLVTCLEFMHHDRKILGIT